MPHAPLEQRYGRQLVVAGCGGTQPPLPLQSKALVSTVVDSHVAASHCVPLGHCMQSPMPLHMAWSSPQVAAVAEVHVPLGSAEPLATSPQTPSWPDPFAAAEHASHCAVQTLLQQTPL